MKNWTLKTWAVSREDADRTVKLLRDDGYTVEVTQSPALTQYFTNVVLTTIFWIHARVSA